ncbi:MAG TPA: glutathione S-transferase family protein [Thiopseudomonas sp.]|nr:glutathione S-transferase family protein [Thiopseudomonas sp.]
MALVLYGAALSPFVRKVRACLLEKQLEYSNEMIVPGQQPQWFYDISPLGRIPALRDGDFTLCDSAVICAYLAEKYPQNNSLLGNTVEESARIRWFEKYADYEVAPLATFTVFFNRVLAKSMGGSCDEAAIEKALVALEKHYDYLEAQLAGQEYFVGNRFSLADLAVVTHWVNLSYAKEQLNADKWPKLAAHKERILARDSLQQLLAEERKLLVRLALQN